jgi:hypothetical protein
VTASTLGIKTSGSARPASSGRTSRRLGFWLNLAAPWSDRRRLLLGELEYVKLRRIPVTA